MFLFQYDHEHYNNNMNNTIYKYGYYDIIILGQQPKNGDRA